MGIRGLNFVAQAVSHAQEQADLFKQRRNNFDFSQQLSSEQQALVDDLERQIAGNCPSSGFSCPCCDAPMYRLQCNDFEIDVCLKCNSLWFDKGELKSLLQSKDSKEIPGDHLRSRGSRYDCPHCEEAMEEYVFKNPSNLLVDRCNTCYGILLEDNELERALDLSS